MSTTQHDRYSLADAPDKLTISEAAVMFHQSEQTIRNWIRRGVGVRIGDEWKRVTLEAVRLGKKFYTSETAVRRFLDAIQP